MRSTICLAIALLSLSFLAASSTDAAVLINATVDLDASPPTVTLLSLDDDFGDIEGLVFQAVNGEPTSLTIVSWTTDLVVAELASVLPGDYLLAVQSLGDPLAFFTLTVPDPDADTLDGLDSGQFLRSDVSTNFTSGTLTTDAGTTLEVDGALDAAAASSISLPDTGISGAGPGSGLDADSLDGLDSGAFLPAGTDLWVDVTGDAMTGDLDLVGANVLKDGTLFLHDNGNTNTALGAQALQSVTIGSANTAVGDAALRDHTTGVSNTAAGHAALLSNTTGSNNSVLGRNAMIFNTAGTNNTALGNSALAGNTLAHNNTAVGSGALRDSTIGSANTAVGYTALLSNAGGAANTAVGAFALRNSTGSGNIALGNNAGSDVTTGSNNIHIGNTTDGSAGGLIKIGTQGTQEKTFVAGIRDVTPDLGDAVAVVIDSAGQLGTVSPDSIVEIVKVVGAGSAATAMCPPGYALTGCSGGREETLADTCDEDECGYIGTIPVDDGHGCLTRIDPGAGTEPVAVAYCLLAQ